MYNVYSHAKTVTHVANLCRNWWKIAMSVTLDHIHNRKINSDTTQTDRAVAAIECQRDKEEINCIAQI